MSVSIGIENVVKKFGDLTVVKNLSTYVKNGEFFTLLGPSGCGKTTLLRMIAGFNTIEDGLIKFDDTVINSIPAQKRNIGMVFQNYAIFPHMTVRQNVEYGLKLRKIPKSKMAEEVDRILKVVKIDEYASRMPDKLSGGQQQRVALARAIVIKPQVLLMDEPLSNLDAKLRIEMRSAIRDIQKEFGITTIYVTHDQEEALAISDRIAVMNEGIIQQIGTPESIYARPYNVFVSTFIGHSNLFLATLKKSGEKKEVVFTNGYTIEMPNITDEAKDGQEVVVSVRPEEFSLGSEGLKCEISNTTFLGKYINYFLKFEDKELVPNQPSIEFSQDLGHIEELFKTGDTITLKINAKKVNVFTKEMDKTLIKDVKQYD